MSKEELGQLEGKSVEVALREEEERFCSGCRYWIVYCKDSKDVDFYSCTLGRRAKYQDEELRCEARET